MTFFSRSTRVRYNVLFLHQLKWRAWGYHCLSAFNFKRLFMIILFYIQRPPFPTSLYITTNCQMNLHYFLYLLFHVDLLKRKNKRKIVWLQHIKEFDKSATILCIYFVSFYIFFFPVPLSPEFMLIHLRYMHFSAIENENKNNAKEMKSKCNFLVHETSDDIIYCL